MAVGTTVLLAIISAQMFVSLNLHPVHSRRRSFVNHFFCALASKKLKRSHSQHILPTLAQRLVITTCLGAVVRNPLIKRSLMQFRKILDDFEADLVTKKPF